MAQDVFQGERESTSSFCEENHARDFQEIEELRSICCEEADRARQARIGEFSLQQQRNPTTVSQMMAQILGITEQSEILVR